MIFLPQGGQKYLILKLHNISGQYSNNEIFISNSFHNNILMKHTRLKRKHTFLFFPFSRKLNFRYECYKNKKK